MAGHLSTWLKRCVIPSPPHDGITPFVSFSTIQLVYRQSLGLLPAMVCDIQNGLKTLTEQFYRRATTIKVGKEFIFPRDGPSSRIKMLYAYLMAWFALHCPVLIQLGEEAPEGVHFTHLCRFENTHWKGKYLAWVRRMVGRQDSYSLF